MPLLFQLLGVVLLAAALLLAIGFIVVLALFSDTDLFRAIWHWARRPPVDPRSVEDGFIGLDTAGWYLPSQKSVRRRSDSASSGESQR